MSRFRNTIISLLSLTLLISCQNQPVEQTSEAISSPKLSLAQWSFHRELFAGEMNNFDFIRTAGEMGFEGVEYVNQFFMDQVENFDFLDSLKIVSAEAGVKNLMLMIDDVGNFGDTNLIARNQAVEECKKWILAAEYLGCTSIRVNAHGNGNPDEMKAACFDAIGRLGEFGQTHQVMVLVENHGLISSNGAWLADLVKTLEPKGVACLADFDNWCYEREGGGIWDGKCIKLYDRYQGMKELMPYAKSVSLKSINFDEAGEESNMNYKKLIEIVQDAAFEGYLGVEFAGSEIPSKEGVEKTKALALKYWKKE